MWLTCGDAELRSHHQNRYHPSQVARGAGEDGGDGVATSHHIDWPLERTNLTQVQCDSDRFLSPRHDLFGAATAAPARRPS